MRIDQEQCAISARLQADADQEVHYPAAANAISLYRFRRKRDLKFEGLALFEDPAWDILLSIYIDEAADRPISVSSACIASNVAQTTALRWIARLQETGAIVREDDPFDGRRSNLRLTPAARERMNQLLSGL